MRYLLLFLSPVVLRACCVENYKWKNAGRRQDGTHERQRAVEGEMFMFPCLGQENPQVEAMWTRTGEEKKHLTFVCGMIIIAETQHSGEYTCLKCVRNRSFHLQVLERKGLGCFQPEEGTKYLLGGKGGAVSCPGLNCSDNTDVIWYKLKHKHKRVEAVSEQRRSSCQRSGWLHLCRVHEYDTGVYFCDRQTADGWILRRAVNVTVVPYYTPPHTPMILYPNGNSTEEVELGEPHTLECRIHFPIEIKRTLPPEAQWYVTYNMADTSPVLLESRQLVNATSRVVKVTQMALIGEVTPQHLDNTYTCMASNAMGSSVGAVRFKQRLRANRPSLVKHAIGPFLLLLGMGIVLHANWLELQLIFRSHFQLGNQHKVDKGFDVFLSFVWPRTSSQSAPGTDEEGDSGSNLIDRGATYRPLEVLLPQVLEEWGHRICLLERDVLPGGAFANDVVLAIQRSQMLICVLSADYLSDTNAVFILESGLQALLLKSSPKLLLIWTNKASAAQVKPDPPLPILVQRALKVLPSLDWTSGKPERGNGNFWSSLKKSLPEDRVRAFTDVGETDFSLQTRPCAKTVDM